MPQQNNRLVSEVARLMCEMDSVMAPSQPSQPLMTFNQMPGGSESRYENNGYEDQFDDDELKLAKQFIEIVGCPDRARDLLDRAIECGDCLGMVDNDSQTIEAMAMIIPDTPDLPTNGNMAAQFNPSQITQ